MGLLPDPTKIIATAETEAAANLATIVIPALTDQVAAKLLPAIHANVIADGQALIDRLIDRLDGATVSVTLNLKKPA